MQGRAMLHGEARSQGRAGVWGCLSAEAGGRCGAGQEWKVTQGPVHALSWWTAMQGLLHKCGCRGCAAVLMQAAQRCD